MCKNSARVDPTLETHRTGKKAIMKFLENKKMGDFDDSGNTVSSHKHLANALIIIYIV